MVGVLAGLLGIGGGVVIVPSLAYVFTNVGLPQAVIMHMAESTALAAITLPTLTAVIVQQRKKAIRWDIFRSLSIGIILGTMIGAASASLLSSQTLKILFGLFISAVAMHMFFSKKQEFVDSYKQPKGGTGILAGFLVGAVSGMLGIGGGIFVVPILLRFGLSAHNAAATSSACALMLSIVGTLSYIATGWNISGLPPGSSGYVYWPAVLGIGLASIIFVPLGTKLASLLSGKTLIRIFAGFLLLVGILMVLGA